LGILQFFLSRSGIPPFVKLLSGLVFVILLFSPLLNAFLLAGIMLLGVAENWVPFRVSKQDGPPSTPEAGDSET
jgi:hypothetical protein